MAHPLAHSLLMRSTEDRSTRAQPAVRGTDKGSTYTDDYGNDWKIDEGFLFWSASTTAYGGSTTEDRSTRAQTIGDIDRRAAILHDIGKAAKKAAEGAFTDTPPADKPSGGSGAAPTIRKAITTFAPPAAPGKKVSPWAYVAAVTAPVGGWFIRGPVGLGVGLLVGVGAWILGKRAAAKTS